MDPYLEAPAYSAGIAPAADHLYGDSPERGPAAWLCGGIGERLYVVETDRSIYPDVWLMERPLATVGAGGGGTEPLPAGPGDLPWVVAYDAVEVREVFIEIVTTDGRAGW